MALILISSTWCLSPSGASWTDHVLEAKTKATRVLNLLRRSMQGCSTQAKARAYTALVCPHLETCAPVWTPYQKGAQDDLEKVQRRAVPPDGFAQSGTR